MGNLTPVVNVFIVVYIVGAIVTLLRYLYDFFAYYDEYREDGIVSSLVLMMLSVVFWPIFVLRLLLEKG